MAEPYPNQRLQCVSSLAAISMINHFGFDLLGERERETEQASKTVGKDLAELVLKEASKIVSNRDMKEKLSAEEVTTIQLLEDVAKLVVDAAKLILKDKEGVKETAKLILKEALKEAAIVIVEESVELAVKEEAKLIIKALEKKIDHHPTTDSSKEGINHWINKFI